MSVGPPDLGADLDFRYIGMLMNPVESSEYLAEFTHYQHMDKPLLTITLQGVMSNNVYSMSYRRSRLDRAQIPKNHRKSELCEVYLDWLDLKPIVVEEQESFRTTNQLPLSC